MKEIDYLGTVSGYKIPDKFERTGLKAEKSKYVDAPIIIGSPVVIECELIEFVETETSQRFLQEWSIWPQMNPCLTKTGKSIQEKSA